MIKCLHIKMFEIVLKIFVENEFFIRGGIRIIKQEAGSCF